MFYKFGKTIIIALGGSIIYPDNIDIKFIKKFKAFIKEFLKRKIKFVLVIGGGAISRYYQKAASKIISMSNEDKDWLGIHATRLNAQLIRTIFKEANPVIIDACRKIKKLNYPITVASGWKPGWSTDYIAVALAKDFGINEVIIAGKPDFVYDKDNNLYKDAKPFYNLKWKEYRKLIPTKWIPGLHSPVDPIAAKLADEYGIKAIIINGKDLDNFKKLLLGKQFQGTIIN